MIVLDTHAWLWWVARPSKLSRRARAAVDEADAIGVSAVSAWELAMLVTRGRIELDRDPRTWVAQALARERVHELPLEAGVAVRAGLLDPEGFPGDPADRMIYVTARAHDATLVTRDRRLRSFDPQRTVW